MMATTTMMPLAPSRGPRSLVPEPNIAPAPTMGALMTKLIALVMTPSRMAANNRAQRPARSAVMPVGGPAPYGSEMGGGGGGGVGAGGGRRGGVGARRGRGRWRGALGVLSLFRVIRRLRHVNDDKASSES